MCVYRHIAWSKRGQGQGRGEADRTGESKGDSPPGEYSAPGTYRIG